MRRRNRIDTLGFSWPSVRIQVLNEQGVCGHPGIEQPETYALVLAAFSCGSETPAPSGGAANYAARAMAFPHALRHALAVAVLRRVAAHDLNACRASGVIQREASGIKMKIVRVRRGDHAVLSFARRCDGSSPLDTQAALGLSRRRARPGTDT